MSDKLTWVRETCLAQRSKLDDMDRQLDEAEALAERTGNLRGVVRAIIAPQRERVAAMREDNERIFQETETLLAIVRRGGMNPGGSA
jgi:hypothetical protein